MITTRAPAKLILSGEHSVIYGAPALGMTLNHLTTTTHLSKNSTGKISLKLKNLKSELLLNQAELEALKEKIDKNYIAFLKHEINAQSILEPASFIPYLLAFYAKKYGIVYEGLDIEILSTIPIGFGLGSSASVIVSLFRALSLAFTPIQPDTYFIELSREVENLVHGKSSGFDVSLVFQEEGCLYRDKDREIPFPMPSFPFQLVHTGIPIVNRAESIQAASILFHRSKTLYSKFSQVTFALAEAIKNQKMTEIKQNIVKNNYLLCEIGVIPDKVQECINHIQKRGNAAKICGAGASSGEHAGVLWVVGETPIADILTAYGYKRLNDRGQVS